VKVNLDDVITRAVVISAAYTCTREGSYARVADDVVFSASAEVDARALRYQSFLSRRGMTDPPEKS